MNYFQKYTGLIKLILSSLYLGFTIYMWDQEPICAQRMNVIVAITFFLGINKCISIFRLFSQEKFLDFEITIIMIIVYIQNERFNQKCLEASSSIFEHMSVFLFFIILISNSIYFAIAAIFLILSLIQYLLLSNEIYNYEYFDQKGITNQQLNQLIKPLNNEFSKDDCAICLSQLGEPSKFINQVSQQTKQLKFQNINENENQQINEGNLIVCLPNCLHKFHFFCAKEWLKNHQTCPFCRQNLKDLLKIPEI